MGVRLTIGASGSIFGLLGALVFYGRDRGGSFGIALYQQFLGWAAILFVFGFLWPNVNNWAHAGGFVGGYLIARLVGYKEKKTETRVHRNVAVLTVILVIFSFVKALLTSY